MKYFIYLSLFLVGCGGSKVEQSHLHNYPFLDNCPSMKEKAIDNEETLKAQAKALNMRYVDYLHFLTNSKIRGDVRHADVNPRFPSKPNKSKLITGE